MKRLVLFCLFIILLLCACDSAPADTTVPGSEIETETAPIPQELLGVWVSADPGELDMIETITFGEDGQMTVNLRYQGEDYGTVGGSYTVEGHTVSCHITEGATPYRVEYDYVIDGRMLSLTNGEKTADYLRTS